MTAFPGAEDALREAIARVVDPEAFEKLRIKLPDWAERQKARARDEALAKAAAILALIPRASDEVPANPVGEGLVEALKCIERRIAYWPDRNKYPPNGGSATEWEPFYEANRARKELQDRLPEILAALAGKSADTASSQEQGASGEVAK